jgi:DNA polymerase-3 subunit gamma/tau
VPVPEIVDNLRQIATAEGLAADDEALMLIARQATGSLRDAQSLLDQLSSVGGTISLKLAQSVLGTATNQSVFDLIDSIQAKHTGPGLETIHRALDAGTDPRTLARQIVEYLRGLMLIQMGNVGEVEAPRETKERMTAHAGAFPPQEVLRLMKVFNSAASDTRGGWQPSLPLELAMAEAFEVPGETEPVSTGAVSGGPAGGRGGQVQSGAESKSTGRALKPAPARGPDQQARAGSANEIAESPEAYASGEAKALAGRMANPGLEAGVLSLAEVSKAWKEVRALLKPQHPGVEALLNSCKPVELRGDELLLGFQSDTVRALMDKPENLEATRKAIAGILGSSLRIKCVVMNARGKVPPNLVQDGMVATAINHGGEIVDVQE